MKVDQLAEERLAVVLGVVRLGGRGVERAELQRDDLEVLRLDAADDLAGEAALDGVGLAEDQGAISHKAAQVMACSMWGRTRVRAHGADAIATATIGSLGDRRLTRSRDDVEGEGWVSGVDVHRRVEAEGCRGRLGRWRPGRRATGRR